MNITSRQFEYLSSMGIHLWKRRELTKTSAQQSNSSHVNRKIKSTTKIDLENLLKQQILQDILLSLGMTTADITIRESYLDLGIINWYFTKQEDIALQQNNLYTPSLDNIMNSPHLKKSLWQVINNIEFL